MKADFIQKHWQIILFIIVGSLGFVTDIVVFNIVQIFFEFGFIISRIISIFFALLVTYFFHRRSTFKKQKNSFLYSFPRYILSCSMMQGVNFLIYIGLIIVFPFFEAYPSLALTVGSLSVMILTFIVSKKWIFNEK